MLLNQNQLMQFEAKYVLLKGDDDTSTMSVNQSFEAIQESNKYENKNGRIIKVILGSRVAGKV